MDTAESLQLKIVQDNKVEALLVWIYSTWVNVSGIMHQLDDPPGIRREATEFPVFLFSRGG